MTTKPKETPATTSKADDAPPAVVVEELAADQTRAPGECVVDDGTPHTGRATPGAVICSAHAMHYRADGKKRTP